MTGFQRINHIYDNSKNFKISSRIIDRFSPVSELKRRSSEIFRNLDDELDDSVVDLKIAVWRVMATIELSVLSFNSDILQLSNLLEEVISFSRYFPELSNNFTMLTEVVNWFVQHPYNPKLNEIFKLINTIGSGKRVGVAARLVHGRIPGWDEAGWKSFQSSFPECKKIISVATLRKELFDLIIVPSGGNSVPFRQELFTSFSTPEIIFIHYGCEAKYSYIPFKLPNGSIKFPTNIQPKSRRTPTLLTSEAVPVDDWFDQNFWELTRNTLLRRNGDPKTTDEQFKVKSRLALLGSQKGVYFREDQKVIEISDLIEGRVDIDDFGKKYPRKSVQELKRGNLVVLRTSGSGDALDDVSAGLMMNDGNFELIESSCEWKKLLRKTLERHGTDVVATMLARQGHLVRDPNYLWMWTTKTVIRPESQNTFIDLIKIIKELGYELPEDPPEAYSHRKWEEMRELIKYRMKAGMKIREALLQTLKNFIKKGVQIEDEQHISLMGVGGGELTIFRVSGLDELSQIVPYSKTGVVASVET